MTKNSSRRQGALEEYDQLRQWWGTVDKSALLPDYSDALAVVDAVHEWIYRDDADEAKLLADIVAAHEKYEDGQ